MHLFTFLLLLSVHPATTTTASSNTSHLLQEMVQHLENGQTAQVLSTITQLPSSSYSHDAQWQVILSIAALDQHQYHLAVNASSAALRLTSSSPGMASAARPVLGAALLNLGLWKLAARQLSKCIKGKHGFDTSIETVQHLARARGALKQHKMIAKVLWKYCNNRFSPKRKGYDQDPHRKFNCYSIVGKQFSLARSQHQANQAYAIALQTKPQSFQDWFQPNAMDAFVRSGSEGNNGNNGNNGGGGNQNHRLPSSVELPQGQGQRDLHVLVNTPDFMLFTIDNVLNEQEMAQLRHGMAPSKRPAKDIDALVCIGNTHPLRKAFMDLIYDNSNNGGGGESSGGGSSWRSSMAINAFVNHVRFTKDGKICTNSSLLPPTIATQLRWSSSTFVSGTEYEWLDSKLAHMLPWLDPRNGYPTQLLEYNSGTDYSKHVDCNYKLDPKDRAFTILLYLNSPNGDKKEKSGGQQGHGDGGGETIFARIRKGLVKVNPVPGRLVGFTSLTSNGYCNYKSEHYSNEVQKIVDEQQRRGASTTTNRNKKMVVQKWYARVPHRTNQKSPNRLGANFLKSMFDDKILNPGQGFVSCDGAGSCREFFEHVEDVTVGKRARDEL